MPSTTLILAQAMLISLRLRHACLQREAILAGQQLSKECGRALHLLLVLQQHAIWLFESLLVLWRCR